MAFQLDNIKSQNNSEKEFDIDKLLKKEIHLFGSKFSNKKKEAFYIELSVLLNAGLELKDSLELIKNEQKKQADKELFNTIVEAIISGKNFSEAIKKHKVFTKYEYHSIEIGERTGKLIDVVQELGEFYKRKNEQLRTIKSALSYPIVVMCTAFLAVFFMLKYVVPMFADIFKQNKVELPWVTKKIISLSNSLESSYWIYLLLIVSLIIFVKLFSNRMWFKKYTSKLVLKIPFIGEFTRKIKIAQFTQAISLLVSAKVPLLNGIQLTREMIDYYPLQQALFIVENDVLQGKTLYESILRHKVFDRKMASLIKVAEETNQNETIFKRLTHQYNQEIEYKSKMLSATLEPIIILFLGAIIAVILVAMYLPMFKLSTVIN